MKKEDYQYLDTISKLSFREIDCKILEDIYNFICKVQHPDWYPLPVKCFYDKSGKYIMYSYDENACNAMMFRNGKDETDGFALPVPSFSTDFDLAIEILEKHSNYHIEKCNNIYTVSISKNDRWVKALDEILSLAICKVVLLAAKE